MHDSKGLTSFFGSVDFDAGSGFIIAAFGVWEIPPSAGSKIAANLSVLHQPVDRSRSGLR